MDGFNREVNLIVHENHVAFRPSLYYMVKGWSLCPSLTSILSLLLFLLLSSPAVVAYLGLISHIKEPISSGSGASEICLRRERLW